jgi:hypothetical protein
MPKVVAELVVDGQQVFIRQLDQAEGAVEGVGEGAEKSGKKVSGMTSAMTALGGALATRELVQWGADAANYATQLGAMQRKADTVFGEAVVDIRAFSEEHAARFGLATDALTGLAAGYGDLLVPMGFSRDQAAELTGQTLELAGALGEWSPQLGGAQHALEALGAAMTGEREQLKAYGIVIDEAAVKAELLARGQQDLTGEAERQATAMATLDLALRGSADAQAAFAAGGDPAIVAAAEAKAAYAEMRAELGQNLIPVMSAIQGAASDVLGAFTAMPAPVQNATLGLLGLTAGGVAVAGVADKVGDAVEALGTMRTRLPGVTSFLTGPWGLALAGGVAAVGLFAKAKADAAAEIGEYVTALEADTGAIGENTRAHVVAELSQRGHLETANRLGINVATLTDAVLGNRVAWEQVQGVLDPYRASVRDTTSVTSEHAQAAIELGNALGMERDQLADGQAELVLQQDAMRGNVQVTREYVDASFGFASAQAEVARATRSGVDVTWGLTAAHHASLGAAIAYAAQQDRMAEAVRRANQRMQEQSDRLRADVDPVFAAASAQQRYEEATRRAGEADTSAERATAQDEVARAALDLQGALITLNTAQQDGTVSQLGFNQAMEALQSQGLLDGAAVQALTEDYNALRRAAEGARDAVAGVTSPSTSISGGVQEFSGAAPASASFDAVAPAAVALAPTASFSGLQVGQVVLQGADPSRPGEAQRFAEDFVLEVAERLEGYYAAEAAK